MVGGSEVSVQSGKAWPIRLRLHADMAWEWSDMALFGHTGLGEGREDLRVSLSIRLQVESVVEGHRLKSVGLHKMELGGAWGAPG